MRTNVHEILQGHTYFYKAMPILRCIVFCNCCCGGGGGGGGGGDPRFPPFSMKS